MVQELLRHSSSRVTMEIYAQAADASETGSRAESSSDANPLEEILTVYTPCGGVRSRSPTERTLSVVSLWV